MKLKKKEIDAKLENLKKVKIFFLNFFLEI